MRILLTLRANKRKSSLPVNYNYFLTGLIYSIIGKSSEDYSKFLHDEGFKPGDSKKSFKLFTYSMLRSRFKVVGNRIFFNDANIQWYISSPMDNFIQHLINGVFIKGQEIKIGPEGEEVLLLIERVETLPKPEFKKTMRFTCLSPVTVSKVKSFSRSNGFNRWNGSLKCHYLRPWEEGFSEAIKNNLIKKYELLTGRKIEDSLFSIKIDEEYMNKKAGKIIKNINFKGTNIIGFFAPFEIAGNPELIEVGYETGFGEKGSMGFGMVKIKDSFSRFSSFNRSNR